jgi:protein required for attachment to host cells
MSFRHAARRFDTTLIVVADRGQARLFTAPWPELEPADEVDGMIHPESRLRELDTVSDKPGRFRTPAGQHASTDNVTDFRHRTAERFAKKIITRLESGREHLEFSRLVLVAPALFLGELRRESPAELAKLTAAEIDKDLVQASQREIMEHVRAALQTPAAAE